MCSIPVTVFILKVPFFTISRMPGMRKSAWPSGAKFPLPGRRSASAVILRCRAGQQNEGWLCPPRQREERVQRHAGPVSGWPKLSQAVCAVCSCAPGVINHHPGGAALQSRAECHRKGWLCPPRQKALLCKGVFLGYLAPVGTPPGGWKKVGEKPSFSPRASGGVSFRYDRYFGLVPK